MAWYRCVGGAGGSLKLRTASGRIATFNTNMVEAFKSLQSDINPVQDLHGYSKPWSGGGGKNKAQVTATSQTISGVAYTVATDGRVKANGTASGASILDLGTITLIGGTKYTLTGCPSGGSGSTYALFLRGSGSFAQKIDFGGGISFTVTDTVTTTLSLIVYNGYNASNLKFEPMVRLSNTSADYEPYSNICPISGFSALNVTRTGKNLVDNENYFPKSDSFSNSYYFNFTKDARTIPEIQLVADTTYTLSFNINSSVTPFNISIGCGNGTYSTDILTKTNLSNGRVPITFTPTAAQLANGNLLAFRAPRFIALTNATFTISDVQLELGSQATDYSPYNGQTKTVNFGQTVFGGVVNVTRGKVNKTYGIVDLGTLEWRYYRNGIFYAELRGRKQGGQNLICSNYPTSSVQAWTSIEDKAAVGNTINSNIYVRDTDYSDIATFTTAMSGVQLVYELATPIEISTTPENLTAIVGQNNVYADTNGDTEVKYLYRE